MTIAVDSVKLCLRQYLTVVHVLLMLNNKDSIVWDYSAVNVLQLSFMLSFVDV